MLMITGPTQDIEHDSLKIRLPGLKLRDRAVHYFVRLFRLIARLFIRLFVRLFVRHSGQLFARLFVRLFVLRRVLFLCLAHVVPKLVQVDQSPRHARLLLSTLLGAAKLVSRALQTSRALPVPCPLLLAAASSCPPRA